MKRVLIVDDEENVRTVVGYLLENRGFKTEIARNGREALEISLQNKPDIILLDLNMPEMDGIETCKRLRQDSSTREIPIILLSAQQMMDLSIFKNLSGAAIKYFPKPCHLEELINQINRLVV